MSRICRCTRSCRHLVHGAITPLLLPEELDALAGVLSVLVDAAHGYDQDGLQIDPECDIHGERPSSNSECSCRGDRYTAAEFIKAIEYEIRARGRSLPAGQPNRKRNGIRRLMIAS